MNLEPTLTVIRDGYCATLEEWDARKDGTGMGEKVEYISHVLGGMVKVRRHGKEVIIHPHCTAELC